MKGQVSIEFVSLLSMGLLASSILVTAVQDRNIAVQDRNEYVRAEKIAQKVAYKIEYVMADQESQVDLEFSPQLDETYNVNITSNKVTAGTRERSAGVQTAYTGSNHTLHTNKSYQVSYDEGVVIE